MTPADEHRADPTRSGDAGELADRGRGSGAARLVRRLLSKEQRRFLKFALVGGSGVVVNLVVVWATARFLFADLDPALSAKLAFLSGIVVSIFTNFLINDGWTWGDRPKGGRGHWFRRLLDFYLAASIAGAAQFYVSVGARRLLIRWIDTGVLVLSAETVTLWTASLIGIAVGTPVNYVINHFWTFRRR